MVAVQRPGRRRLTLGMLLLAAALLITLDFQGFGPLGTIQTGLREVVRPIRDGAEVVISPATSLWESTTEFDELEAENQALRDEIDRLRGQIVQAGIDRGDLEALLREAGLQSSENFPLLLAPVRNGRIGNFGSSVIELEVGSTDGVQKDMAVVTAAGLVGRIQTVDRTSSTVLLVSDPDFVIGAEVIGEVGLARGIGSATQMRIEQGISGPVGEQIEVGDPVTTTRSERSLFPANLIIGTVAEIDIVDSGERTEITIDLAADPADLRFVNVVLLEPGADLEEERQGANR